MSATQSPTPGTSPGETTQGDESDERPQTGWPTRSASLENTLDRRPLPDRGSPVGSPLQSSVGATIDLRDAPGASEPTIDAATPAESDPEPDPHIAAELPSETRDVDAASDAADSESADSETTDAESADSETTDAVSATTETTDPVPATTETTDPAPAATETSAPEAGEGETSDPEAPEETPRQVSVHEALSASTLDLSGHTTDVTPAPVPPRAPAPTAAPLATRVAAALALALLALAAIAAREALVAADRLSGRAWSPQIAERIDGLTPQSWMAPAGIAAVVIGAGLVVTSLWRRRRTHVAVIARSAVYTRPKDVATLAEWAAQDVPEVLHARAEVSRRSVVVRVETSTRADGLTTRVESQVADRLKVLVRPPRVKVRLLENGDVR